MNKRQRKKTKGYKLLEVMILDLILRNNRFIMHKHSKLSHPRYKQMDKRLLLMYHDFTKLYKRGTPKRLMVELFYKHTYCNVEYGYLDFDKMRWLY